MRITFLTGINRSLNGNTIINEPLGGTHSAMINLAGELVKLGHQVTIFCNCKDNEGFYNGVEYLLTGKIVRFSRENEIDIYICVATESSLKVKLRAKKTVLWLHNDYSPYWDNELPDIAAQISGYMTVNSDKVVTVSQWQAGIINSVFKVPKNHIAIKSNGVNLELFQGEPLKRKKRLIYSSAPDRGLDLLLAFFPEIKKACPEVELHIYSSFSTWGKSEPEFVEAEQEIFGAAHQEGVFLHEPVPGHLLASAMLDSYLWVYPNHAAPGTYFYGETFCNSALEAQAAGLPVITSKRAALPEIVLNGETGLLIDGDPYSPEFKEKFIEATVNLLEGKSLWQRYSENARSWSEKFSWTTLALQWQDFFSGLLSETTGTKLVEAPLSSLFPPPRVSVIIPTYNRANNLFHALNSLLCQDFTDFEVIISDDGSTDNTRELVDSFRNRLNIRYAWCGVNKGFRAARTRNTGLKKARGELIIFLDSDIVVPPAFISEHIKAHAAYEKILVNSYVYRQKEYIEEDLGLPPAEYIPRHFSNLLEDVKAKYNVFERKEPIDQGYYLDSNCFSIKAEHIRNEGFDPEFVGWGFEDVELGYRFGRRGFKFLFIRENCTAYHIYHKSTPAKEDESARNWERLAKKYKLKKWYIPLPSLKVGGLVKLDGLDPEKANMLIDLADAEFELKVGEKFPGYIPCLTFEVKDGIIYF